MNWRSITPAHQVHHFGILRTMQQFCTALDRGQRIAQLMRKRGHELVLLPGGLAQFLLRTEAVGDVVIGLKNGRRFAGLCCGTLSNGWQR